jgi:hydroxymethylpyrimidine pyrophosphatase-like HAD family hydrolase
MSKGGIKKSPVRSKRTRLKSTQVDSAKSASSVLSEVSPLVSESEQSLSESGTRPTRPYRFLGIDLDGTLLDPKGVPHEADKAAIQALIATGVQVTIITGRLFFGTTKIATALGITGPVACADGSHILDAAGNTLVHHPVDAKRGQVVREALRARALTTFVFRKNTIHHDEKGEAFVPFIKLWSSDVQACDSVHDYLGSGDVTSVVAIGNEAAVRMAAQEIETKTVPSLFTAFFPMHKAPRAPVADDSKQEPLWGLIVRSSGATKGTALAWLCAHHQIPIDEAVVVGDWHNDIPMLERAGRSFAMGQAPQLVKDRATDVLSETSSTGGGIARVIRKLFVARKAAKPAKQSAR